MTNVSEVNDLNLVLGYGGKFLSFGSDEVAEILAPEATVSY